MNSPPCNGQQFNNMPGGQYSSQGQMQFSGTPGGNLYGSSAGSNTNTNNSQNPNSSSFPPAGNWTHPPPPFPPPSLHTPPPCGPQNPFSQPPPPCFPPGGQQFPRPPPFPNQNCHNNGPPSLPPPPQHGGPPQQNRPHRPSNNVWSDPSLFQPNFGTPRHQHPNQFGFGRGGGPNGWGQGRGGGGGGRWTNNNSRGRGGRGGGGGCGGGGGPLHHQQQGGNHFNNGKGQNTKKAKVNKRDCPENNVFHCETCDRGFKTEEKHKEHVSEHKKCWVEGCRYVAAPKLVELHYNTQHRTGLAKRIWSLESPEDIEKWIQERKRNFPTKENKARKAAEATQKQNRGEVIETKQFGKMRGRGGRGRGGRRGRFGRHGHWGDDSRNSGDSDNTPPNPLPSAQQASPSQPSSQTEEQTKNETVRQGRDDNNVPRPTSAEDSDSKRAQLPTGSAESVRSQKRQFSSLADGDSETGSSESSPSAKKAKANPEYSDKTDDLTDPLSLLIEGKNSISKDGDSDDNDADTDDNNDVVQEVLPKGLGLTSLISSYDSSSKDEDSDDEVASPVKSPPKIRSPQPTKSPVATGSAPKPKPSQPQQPSAKGPTRKQQQKGNKYGRKSSLLEMLLANEIRHERNVILQCVHYIVKKNFLGVQEGVAAQAGASGGERKPSQ